MVTAVVRDPWQTYCSPALTLSVYKRINLRIPVQKFCTLVCFYWMDVFLEEGFPQMSPCDDEEKDKRVEELSKWLFLTRGLTRSVTPSTPSLVLGPSETGVPRRSVTLLRVIVGDLNCINTHTGRQFSLRSLTKTASPSPGFRVPVHFIHRRCRTYRNYLTEPVDSFWSILEHFS